MSDWYEREIEMLDKDYENGLISDDDYKKQIRDMNAALRAEAEEEAESAYNNVMGGW